jgi:hypothetical protein
LADLATHFGVTAFWFASSAQPYSWSLWRELTRIARRRSLVIAAARGRRQLTSDPRWHGRDTRRRSGATATSARARPGVDRPMKATNSRRLTARTGMRKAL